MCFATSLIILSNFGLLLSHEYSHKNVRSLTETRGNEKSTINTLIEKKLSQLHAIRRRLQDHENIVEMTNFRQSLQQKISKMKQELQTEMIRYQEANCGRKQLHSSTTQRIIRTGNIVTGE